MRNLFVVLLLAGAVSASAQTADLRVSLEGPPTALPHGTYTFRGTVFNAGNADARDVKLSLYLAGYGKPCYYDTPIGTIAAGERRTFDCTEEIVFVSGQYVLLPGITAVSSTPDANPRDNNAQLTVDILTRPDLAIEAKRPAPVMPGEAVTLGVTYRNLARVAAHDVTITVAAPDGFVRVPDICSGTPTRVVCRIGTLGPTPPAEPGSLEVVVRAPAAAETKTATTFAIASPDGDERDFNDRATATLVTYRLFTVTTAADSGTGSLRATLTAANDRCVGDWPCKVTFAIDGPGPWQTIAVKSLLPALTGRPLIVDGTTQRDTNPDGPDVEITTSASLAAGIQLIVPDTEVRGLAIGGFQNGVVISVPLRSSPGVATVARNYIGVDPTGRRAAPNVRGIYVSSDVTPQNDDSGRFGSSFRISDNVIGGNVRSGVYVEKGVGLVDRNVIGLTPTLTAGIGNGASGVYVARGGGGTEVSSNYIGFNTHFGIGVEAGTRSVAMRWNSIQANQQGAIDIGLDGVTPREVAVEITGARFDNGVTVIEGTLGPAAPTREVHLYANDAPDPSGYGEAQSTLGVVVETSPPAKTFRFVYNGDLRGKWVTATATEIFPLPGLAPRADATFTSTSELSRAVLVQ